MSENNNGHDNNGRDKSTGRFVRGNTAGKGHRGTRDRLAEHFLRELHEVWKEHGKPALLHLAKTDQAKFVSAVIQSLPRNDTLIVQHRMELLTDEELVRIIREAESGEDTISTPPDPAQLN